MPKRLKRSAVSRLRKLVVGVVAVTAVLGAYAKDVYPSKPVRIIVGFAPGGATDIIARVIAAKLTASTGQQFIVDNRAGVGSNLGAQVVAKAEPDGYTLYASSVANTINMSLYATPGYDFAKGMEPVAMFARVPNLLVVHPSVPVKSVKEYIAYAKANPGKVTFASSGSGTSIHMSGELFKSMGKVDILHVPYRGSGPALTDLMGGQVASMFDNIASSLPLVKAGKLRALAVTGAKRSPAAPDIPTISESGLPGYEVESWFGLNAPAKTPAPVIAKLNEEVNKALASKDVQARLLEMGAVPTRMSPGEYGAFINAEVKKWAPVVSASGAKAD